MSATPGACIKPGLVRRPLCHKVNLPSCVSSSAAVVPQSREFKQIATATSITAVVDAMSRGENVSQLANVQARFLNCSLAFSL